MITSPRKILWTTAFYAATAALVALLFAVASVIVKLSIGGPPTAIQSYLFVTYIIAGPLLGIAGYVAWNSYFDYRANSEYYRARFDKHATPVDEPRSRTNIPRDEFGRIFQNKLSRKHRRRVR